MWRKSHLLHSDSKKASLWPRHSGMESILATSSPRGPPLPTQEEELHPSQSSHTHGTPGPKVSRCSATGGSCAREQRVSELTLLGTQVHSVYLPVRPLFCLRCKKREQKEVEVPLLKSSPLRRMSNIQELVYLLILIPINSNLHQVTFIDFFLPKNPISKTIQGNIV